MFLSLLATSASAAGGTGGISLSAGFTPIGSGDAGKAAPGAIAPDYNDAYDSGWTGRIEPYYDFNEMVRGQVGVGYNKWGGKTYQGLQFEDLKVLTYYVGLKFRFLPNSSFRPYVVADIGEAKIDGVKISAPGGFSAQYWNSTTTPFLDIGGGVEFIISQKVSFFLDIRVQRIAEPDSALPPASDSDAISNIPITAGVNFTF
jgi:opacity protein-like surface antigen